MMPWHVLPLTERNRKECASADSRQECEGAHIKALIAPQLHFSVRICNRNQAGIKQ